MSEPAASAQMLLDLKKAICEATRADFPYLLALIEFFWHLPGAQRITAFITPSGETSIHIDDQAVTDMYKRTMEVFSRENPIDRARKLIEVVADIYNNTTQEDRGNEDTWAGKLHKFKRTLEDIRKKEGSKQRSFNRLKTKFRSSLHISKDDEICVEAHIYGEMATRANTTPLGTDNCFSRDTTLDIILLYLIKKNLVDLRDRPNLYLLYPEPTNQSSSVEKQLLDRLRNKPMAPMSLGQTLGDICGALGIAQGTSRNNAPIPLLCVKATWRYPHIQRVNSENTVIEEIYTLWRVDKQFIVKCGLGHLHAESYLNDEKNQRRISAMISWDTGKPRAVVSSHTEWRKLFQSVLKNQSQTELIGKEWWIRQNPFPESYTYAQKVATLDGRKHDGGMSAADAAVRDEPHGDVERRENTPTTPDLSLAANARQDPPAVTPVEDAPAQKKRTGWLRKYIVNPVVEKSGWFKRR